MNKNILLACRDAVIGYDNTVAVNGVSFAMVPVAGGTFTMGATS